MPDSDGIADALFQLVQAQPLLDRPECVLRAAFRSIDDELAARVVDCLEGLSVKRFRAGSGRQWPRDLDAAANEFRAEFKNPRLFTMAVRSAKSTLFTPYSDNKYSLSSTTSTAGRITYRVVHISGLEQNVHWYGQPRVARISMLRPKPIPIDHKSVKSLRRCKGAKRGGVGWRNQVCGVQGRR